MNAAAPEHTAGALPLDPGETIRWPRSWGQFRTGRPGGGSMTTSGYLWRTGTFIPPTGNSEEAFFPLNPRERR